MRRGRSALGLACAGLMLLAAPVSASFHLIKVREIYPAGNASYVVLQMHEPGEYLVAGHHLVFHKPDGSVDHDFVLPNNASITSPNNATVLVAGPGYGAAFPSGPSADDLDSQLNLSASGGAICWTESTPPDCVAWGNFTGPLPAHVPAFTVGSPASPSGVTAGKAIRRTIAPNCPTLLEGADDSEDSATDFSEQTPNPRNNASAVTEMACASIPPQAAIDSKPPKSTNATSAAFTYHSTPLGAEFECKLDAAAFASCESDGIEYPGPLGDGSHTFQVRAKNGNGTGGAASYTWTVDTAPPSASIATKPANPSAGGSASFTYGSTEINSTFQCSLAKEGQGDSFSSCPTSGKTYTALANGTYTFKVRATDQAGNQSTPASYTWEVDNSLADTTPPETTLGSRPADPSGSSTAFFAYASNEPGSTFECRLDAAGFAPCPATGATYAGLAEGAHSFQVRAIDPSSNADPSPAGYSFSVVLAPPTLAPPTSTPTAKPGINWRKRCRRLKSKKARKRCLRRHHVTSARG